VEGGAAVPSIALKRKWVVPDVDSRPRRHKSWTTKDTGSITPSSLEEERVTHVSGTKCYLCFEPLQKR
jgi:hypothetical protein